MKRFLFIFIVACISIVGIYGTLQIQKAQEIAKSKKDLENFLNYETGIYFFDSSKKDFSSKNLESNFKYYLISSVDGIYFQSKDKEPIKIQKIGDTTNISIGEGIYIFVLNDIFEKYKINGKNYSVNQLGKGIFFVSNIDKNYKIYSFNSILNIGLNTNDKEIVNFDLFPSLIFKYDSEYNDALVGGDIIRISTVNSIFFADSKSSTFINNLSAINSNYDTKNFINQSLDDISNRYKQNQVVYKELLNLEVEEISGLNYINKYSPLLTNDTKKDVYYKNQILIYFLKILKSGDKKFILEENKLNLANALVEIKNYSDIAYKEGIDLLKSYYYLSYYSNNLNNTSSFSGTISKNNINKNIKDIFKDDIAGKEYFSDLSEVFFAYNFTGFSKNQLDEYLNKYLKELKNNNILKEKDFLNFSFFLTQYSLGNNNISKDSVGISVHIIDLFNSYYLTLKTQDAKYSALNINFFYFSKIIGNLVNNILGNYFEKVSGNIVLKEKFTNNTGGQYIPNIGDELIETIGILYKNLSLDMQNKKDQYYLIIKNNTSSNNYVVLEDKLKKLGYIYNTILFDYNTYLSKFKLNENERNTVAQIKDNTLVLSKESLIEYLQKFDSVDFETLKILNESTMNSDRYYYIEVYMFKRKFSFKLFPDQKYKNTISSIEWENENGEINRDDINNPSLDQKEEYLKDKVSSIEDQAKRQRYEFKNFFYNTYISNNNYTEDNLQQTSYNSSNNDQTNTESSNISIFKQTKLLDGDFTYISKFIDIPFNSIKVTIENGKYVISIKNIYKSFNIDSISYSCEMEMGYLFNEHSFENIKIRLTQEDRTNGYLLDGNYINIVPLIISHKDFSKKLENLGYYLGVIQRNYNSSATSLKIDLNLKKVFIDSKSFDVIINK